MEKYTALILADNHQQRAQRKTYPSVPSMAEDALMSERTFQRNLAELERKGVIRREWPDGKGRGKLTYYYFPELDERGSKRQERGVETDEKGCQSVTLFLQEGCQKGDRRVTKTGSPILSNKYNKSNKEPLPQPPQGGGDGAVKQPAPGGLASMRAVAVMNPVTEQAVDQVMQGCGFGRRRVRALLRRAVQLEVDKGEPAPSVALAMIAAWKQQAATAAQGFFSCAPYGVEKFFGDGHWRNPGSWPWDKRALDRHAEASVGVMR
ncbi:helix-turn-helix domain-containing protein [Acidicapsa dinghuensis]|uniref:Helix-turn-helix domain-containing protein n=1 Tax=Acidicapsa dinghuensis TaxID=2218256 RepID=A0ABW1EDL5_9BACT|nr:helix-turn-helix domain-containing protein [Acidicapsa dinghuensis]